MPASTLETQMARNFFNAVPLPNELRTMPVIVAIWIDGAAEASGCTTSIRSQELSDFIGDYLKKRGVGEATIAEAFTMTRNAFRPPDFMVRYAGIGDNSLRFQKVMNPANPSEILRLEKETKRIIQQTYWLENKTFLNDRDLHMLYKSGMGMASALNRQIQSRRTANSNMELLRMTRTNMTQRPVR